MERLFSPPTGGYPQEVPDYWRFADGTIRKDLQFLSDESLNNLGWTGPISIPVAKQVNEEGEVTNEDEYDFDAETHNAVWYAKERKFVIIGKNESELPYLPNAVISPKPDAKWSEFKKQAVSSVELNIFIGNLMTIAPVAATALPVTLMSLELGNFQDFMTVWGTIENATTVPAELIEEMTALAESCNLPEEFVSIFAA
jgi:hypothetical protein